MPVISVITACHPDRQQFLVEAAHSVLSQVLPESWALEWCLQFDGEINSDDLEFVDPRVLIGFNRTHLGTAKTRNHAIARSIGDVLIQLDADDMLVPGALTLLLPHFEDARIGWVVGRADDLHPDGATEPFFPSMTGDIEPGHVSSYWLNGHLLPFHSAGFCARRELIIGAGLYPNLQAAEDIGLVLAVTDASPGRVIAELTTLYRKWPEQTTASADYYGQEREDCLRQIEDDVRARRQQ